MSTTTKISAAITAAQKEGRLSSEFGIETLAQAIIETIAAIDSSDDGTVGADAIEEFTAGAGTTIKNHVVAVTTATYAPDSTETGSLVTLGKADGVTLTLPALSAANIGIKYKFAIIVSCTSVGYVINTTGSDVFIGGLYQAIANPDAANDMEFSSSTVNKTITLDATTKCGLIGGWVEVEAISATEWFVSGVVKGSGTLVTPFSN